MIYRVVLKLTEVIAGLAVIVFLFSTWSPLGILLLVLSATVFVVSGLVNRKLKREHRLHHLNKPPSYEETTGATQGLGNAGSSS
jgi:drug/metabolite transporter (DMT)-like permease